MKNKETQKKNKKKMKEKKEKKKKKKTKEKEIYRETEQYLQSARSQKQKTKKLRKRLTMIDLLKACGWWGHVSATSASPRVLNKKTGYVTLFHCCSWRSV